MNWSEVLKDRSLPKAIVDLDAIQSNIEFVDSQMKGTPQTVRLATKSIRVPSLIRYILDQSQSIHGLMCFSAKEASYLSRQGFDDFLIAYPSVQESELDYLRDIHERGKKVSLVVDSIEHLEKISDFMGPLEKPFCCVLEIDMSLRLFGGLIHLGVRRSPVRSVSQALSIFQQSKSFKNIKLMGVMGYEAQVAGVGDKNPFKKLLNPILSLMRKASMSFVRNFRSHLFDELKRNGFSLELFNGGGSGSLNLTIQEKHLTEVTVGSGIICSHLFDYYSNIQFKPAVYFALSVVRKSDSSIATCQGGGYIASGEPGLDRLPLPVFPKGLSLTSMEGAGEVQTPVVGSRDLEIGDFVVFRHAKSGELAERFNEYLVVSKSQNVDKYLTYRGLGQCYF